MKFLNVGGITRDSGFGNQDSGSRAGPRGGSPRVARPIQNDLADDEGAGQGDEQRDQVRRHLAERTHDLHLLISDAVRAEIRRWLHRDETKELEQMVRMQLDRVLVLLVQVMVLLVLVVLVGRARRVVPVRLVVLVVPARRVVRV